MTEHALPSGTVTFLFSDVEGSTRLWEDHPDAMRAALVRHDELMTDAIAVHDGYVVKTTGDGFHAVFASAHDAIVGAVAAQRTIEAEPWSPPVRLRARIGVHSGEAHQRAGDYYGSSTNRAARLMSAGHGGQVVVSGVTAALVAEHLPDDIELVALGEHRLRDLAEAMAVFQLAASGLPREFPPLRSLDAYPSNLPVQLSSFVGRDGDVAEIAKLLRDRRLVTLTGVGGVGKTRLALQVAAEVLPRFPDGAWLCELAPVRDPNGVVDAVANAFQVTARPGMSVEDSLIAYLRSQELLIVLDNCEHVLRAVAALVTAIEGACPRVRVLATSREGLSVRGEQMLAVRSLEVPDATTSLEALSAYEAVQLFVDRARGVKANFVLDVTTADGVAQVCQRLDGVPLAIELAAARVGAMNPAELARRLDRRFRLLTGGDRMAIERHQTLRAAIDWSYDLLTEPEQRLLDRMSVFVGGCTLEAVEAVGAGDPVDPDDVFDLVANLVARSLVVADDTGPETRYRLLETIRQYAEERLVERGETDALRGQHCDFYTEFAADVDERIYGPQQVELGARLARERDNLLAAMRFAIAIHDADRAIHLLCALPSPAAQVNDLVVFDAEDVLAMPGIRNHPLAAWALAIGANSAGNRGDSPRARELGAEALAVEPDRWPASTPTPATVVPVIVSYARAYASANAGNVEAAVGHYLDAAGSVRAGNLPVALAAQALTFAGVTGSTADPTTARAHASEALVLARRSGMPAAISGALLTLALALVAEEPDQARALLEEASELESTLGYENLSTLVVSVSVTARLRSWPRTLRDASRYLRHTLRSGSAISTSVLGVLNLTARGLAEDRPEAAAVIQGAVVPIVRSFTTGDGADAVGSAGQIGPLDFVADYRREATQILAATLGEDRLRELRAQGAAMDADGACAYACREIDAYLATLDEEPSGV
jgi:predicted ATPase/class 3 adenylate cyclase